MKIKDGEWIVVQSTPDFVRLYIGGKMGEREFKLTFVEAEELIVELRQALFLQGKT